MDSSRKSEQLSIDYFHICPVNINSCKIIIFNWIRTQKQTLMNPRVPKDLIALIRIFQNVDQTRSNLLTKRGNPNSFNLQSLKNLITTKNNESLMLTKSLYFQMLLPSIFLISLHSLFILLTVSSCPINYFMAILNIY